jgi:hypothetical protein
VGSAPDPATMPLYVARGGEQELLAPCGLQGSQFYVFLLKADTTKLQALMDRLFNQPSGGAVKYEAFWDHVALMFTHVDRLSSSDPAQGWAAYGDIAMWVPVIDRSAGGLVPAFKMYPVYMIVDNGSTMATGREMYGFPKEMGWFLEPQTPEFLGDLAADVLGYERNSTTKQTIRTRLWTIQRSSGDATPATTPVSDAKGLIHELERGLKGLFSNLSAEALILFNLLRDGLATPALGLKQFRDIADPTRAVFQSIVEAPLGIKHFRSASILGDQYSFILNDLVTHPVAEDTGLVIGPQQVSFAFWLYADFELGTGKTNWTSGT